MTATMLLGYDVEHRGADGEITRRFLARAAELHAELQIPATFFIVGQTLERNASAFQALLGHPWLDFQQHTYSHVLLKTVCQENDAGTRVWRGGTLEQIRDEVNRTSQLLKDLLHVDCLGITGPYGYYRGLKDRPDILEILHEAGIRFTRTFGRNECDWQPVPYEWQPFWYVPQGFPDMLEFPIGGWQDCILREELGWANLDGYVARLREDMDDIAARGLVWSYCQHDWSSIREDPEMRLTRDILLYAREKGFVFQTYKDYYRQVLPQRR